MVSDWEWGRGTDPVDRDIPDWVISLMLRTLGLAALGGVIYLLVKAPWAQTTKDPKPKTENVVIQRQEIINNDTVYITIYRNTYVR